MIASICLGCRYALQKSFWQASTRHDISLCLSGGGEPEKSFAEGLFLAGHKRLGRRWGLIWGHLRQLALNPRYFCYPIILRQMLLEFLYAYGSSRMRGLLRKLHGVKQWRYVPLFTYVPWDENEIMATITAELKWQRGRESRAAWRSDCTINLLRNYFYGQTLGFTKNDELVSNMIRHGTLSRQPGLERLQQDNQISDEFVAGFFAGEGIPFDPRQLARRIARACPLGWAAHPANQPSGEPAAG